MSFNWLNDEARKFLSRGYLKEGQTPEERVREIADAAEAHLNIPEFSDKFYEYMSRGYYSLASPVWSNYGNKRGLPVSCFGSFISDSMEEIMYSHAENGMLMKNGGGTSGYFGDLRERGAPISDNGESSGAVHFMELFDTLASIVSQGSVRRGFFSAYLPIEHPDAEEFLDIATEGNPIQGLTTGITVSNEFLEKMISGDPKARKLWAKVLQRRSEIGFPYILFTDNVNNNKPDVYKDLKMEIYASNMCLKADSIITVKFPFYDDPKDMDIETFVKLWNIGAVAPGTKVKTEKGFCEVTAAAKTGNSKEMIRITDDVTGKVVECTPDHKIYTQNRGWVLAKDLTEDDVLLLIDSTENNKIKIERITYEEEIPVYDITVPETASFFANGILVHNCSEISLPSSQDETFTCVLSSINLLHWDEIVKTDAIETMVYFLDTVVTEFVNKTEGKRYFERANKFAKRHRALGMGVLGWHSYLQSNMISFESKDASKKNLEIAKTLNKRAYEASKVLADMFGEPELLKGYGRRNTTLLAIAPTKSSSFILGQVSQSVEPEFSNCYVKDLAKTKVTIKNPYLENLLIEKGFNTNEVWDSIKSMDGSVQHLTFLTDEEKEVFKTFAEINPYTIVDQAGIRQQYIDQSQSINLMLDPTTSVKEINSLYLHAWEMGVKSLYYSYSMSKAQALSRKKVNSADCAACEA
jgi:ribonucleotide reductase alpha subunit